MDSRQPLELPRNWRTLSEGHLGSGHEKSIIMIRSYSPGTYVLPAAYYEQLIAGLEDLEDARLVGERGQEPFIKLSLDDQPF